MASKTDTRSNWQTWSESYETAPPAACQTLRNLNNAVEWGKMCVFGKEDGDPVPFSINTACMPWVTPNVYPNTAAFYSPATACPTSWSAVSTATSGDQWTKGETALTCCPSGFEGDGRGGCKVGASGTYPVVQCGEADAEENNNQIYTAGQWPATATASIAALQLRYQASDVGSASASNSPTNSGGSTNNNNNNNNNGNGGLSIAAKAAIGTIVPLVFLLGAFAFALLYRRRKQKKAALALAAKNLSDEKTMPPSSTSPYATTSYNNHHSQPPSAKAAFIPPTSHTHETPEWNAELDATEAERQRLVAPHEYEPMSASTNTTDVSELGGMGRVARKPVAPVEMEGSSVPVEVGDAYIAYRPGVHDRVGR
jgi:hypothetical protein